MKIKLFLKKNMKLIVTFILGLIISGTGVYAATAAASDVSYSPPSGSGLSSNVQSAISELYNLSNNAYTDEFYLGEYYARLYIYDNYNGPAGQSLESFATSTGNRCDQRGFSSCMISTGGNLSCCSTLANCLGGNYTYCNTKCSTDTCKKACTNYVKNVNASGIKTCGM